MVLILVKLSCASSNWLAYGAQCSSHNCLSPGIDSVPSILKSRRAMITSLTPTPLSDANFSTASFHPLANSSACWSTPLSDSWKLRRPCFADAASLLAPSPKFLMVEPFADARSPRLAFLTSRIYSSPLIETLPLGNFLRMSSSFSLRSILFLVASGSGAFSILVLSPGLSGVSMPASLAIFSIALPASSPSATASSSVLVGACSGTNLLAFSLVRVTWSRRSSLPARVIIGWPSSSIAFTAESAEPDAA